MFNYLLRSYLYQLYFLSALEPTSFEESSFEEPVRKRRRMTKRMTKRLIKRLLTRSIPSLGAGRFWDPNLGDILQVIEGWYRRLTYEEDDADVDHIAFNTLF